METRYTDFAASLADIDGLTTFEAERLPKWFRERATNDTSRPLASGTTDAQVLAARMLPWGSGEWYMVGERRR
jgi:hypothetical protein